MYVETHERSEICFMRVELLLLLYIIRAAAIPKSVTWGLLTFGKVNEVYGPTSFLGNLHSQERQSKMY